MVRERVTVLNLDHEQVGKAGQGERTAAGARLGGVRLDKVCRSTVECRRGQGQRGLR